MGRDSEPRMEVVQWCDDGGGIRADGAGGRSFTLMLLCFYLTARARSTRQPEASLPSAASEASCSMLRQIVYLPLSLLPPALRIDKH